MFPRFLPLSVIGCSLLLPIAALAQNRPAPQNDSDDAAQEKTSYADIVQGDEPAAWWRFEDDQATAVLGNSPWLPVEIAGSVKLSRPGPRQEKYPLFDTDNHAAVFDKPASFRYDDPGADSPLDFAAGDSITLEAWVNPTKIASGQQVYIIGKGRTGSKGFAADNHNWSLRLLGQGSTCHISFLFRDADNRKGNQDDWHRWISDAGFAPGGAWHHVAVTYTFGKGSSVRGYVDGHASKGKWDYGGQSDEAPVVDDDQVWIGSASKNAAGNSFVGGIDEVAVYRRALSAERIAGRWKIVQPKPYVTNVPIPSGEVLVEVLEGMPDAWTWDFIPPAPSERFTQRDLAFALVPKKYNPHGVIDDRSSPFILWAHAKIELPAGNHRLLVRSRNSARLFVDDKLVAENPFPSGKTDGHNPWQPVESKISQRIRPLQPGDMEQDAEIELAGGVHHLKLEVFVGGKKHRPEVGETSVSIAPAGTDDFWVIGFGTNPTALTSRDQTGPGASPTYSAITSFPLTDAGWLTFERGQRAQIVEINQQRRAAASADYAKYWQRRHEFARAHVGQASGLPYQSIDEYIDARLSAEKVTPAPLTDDHAFVRRLYLDILGITPTADQVSAFIRDERSDKRQKLIDDLLAQPAWADNWVGYWQDVLAENPNIVNPTLNNTGPFRWWLHEALLDNKPLDRFATELILMEGSMRYGGTAGFAVATENDAPLAAKAQNIGLAFLAFDMRCARCHDSPNHDFSQEDLFNLAAMLHRGEQTLPKTSTIPGDDAAHASLLVKVTLKPGQKIAPRWPFEEVGSGVPARFLQNPGDPREELALRVTSPLNPRFAKVMVNRLWARYFGRGIIEPIDDWETAQPTHPELVEWLARELMTHDYDAQHIARLIFNSQAYQRVPTADSDQARLAAAPLRRRMTAEQVLDSLFVAAGKEIHVEEMNVDVLSSRLETSSINLGLPMRAWQFTSMSNERDRPSLSLPAAQTAVTLLETFGWRASRQDPASYREKEPSVSQPAMLANGIIAKRFAQLSEDSVFVKLALEAETPADFVEAAFRQILSRPPNAAERDLFVELLAEDFSHRQTGAKPGPVPGWPARDGVSWANHLQPKSNELRVEWQQQVEKGDLPTTQLTGAWREKAEDMVWALVNSPEFVWLP